MHKSNISKDFGLRHSLISTIWFLICQDKYLGSMYAKQIVKKILQSLISSIKTQWIPGRMDKNLKTKLDSTFDELCRVNI